MKKVLSLATIMIMLLIMLTGCVDVNYEVTLNEDGTADIAYIYGFDKATLEQMGITAEDMTSDMKENAEESGYTIEPYSDDSIEGFTAKKHVENPADISLEEAFGIDYVTDSEENQFRIDKKGSKTTYSQNANIDLSSMDETMASMVTMKYTVNLPAKAGENNASEVSKDGKTLTWNLTAGEVNEINFEASSSSPVVKIVIIVVVALVVLGVIIAVVIMIGKSKKGKNEDEKENTDVIVNVEDSKEEKEETETSIESIEESNENELEETEAKEDDEE